jgi:hypothetical protein
MAKTKSKQPTPKDQAKAYKALKAIHDMLYWDMSHSGEMFYNGQKEWSADLLGEIADVLETIFRRPEPMEICDKCGKPYPEGGNGYDGNCPKCADKGER